MAGLVPAIHAFWTELKVKKQDVDVRDKRGHDGGEIAARYAPRHVQDIDCKLNGTAR